MDYGWHVRAVFCDTGQGKQWRAHVVVVPRVKGLSTKHIRLSGSTSAGTAFVEFDDVQVLLSMGVGGRGKGFEYIVSNFNHEVSFRCYAIRLDQPMSLLHCTNMGTEIVHRHASHTVCKSALGRLN